MNKKAISLILTITLTTSIGTAAFAQSNYSTEFSPKTNIESKDNKKPQCNHREKHLGLGGREFKEKVLKEKFKVSQQEIDKSRADGKSLVDILKAKGVTYEQYKTIMLEAKYEVIDKAVAEGKITEDKAKIMKEKIKARMDSRKDFSDEMRKDKGKIKGKNN